MHFFWNTYLCYTNFLFLCLSSPSNWETSLIFLFFLTSASVNKYWKRKWMKDWMIIEKNRAQTEKGV
jgi:hypothetical protein